MSTQARIFQLILLSSLAFVSANAQNNSITANSAGKVKLGMAVAEVRKAVAPMKLSRTSDGEGVALIAVKRGSVNVMTIYAGEDWANRVNNSARVEQIWVWDQTYKTKNGVHPGMLLSAAERHYGKVKKITMSEIESREFAEFANHPKGIDFRLQGKNDQAGVYAPGSSVATAYTPGAYIDSVQVTGRDLAAGGPARQSLDEVAAGSIPEGSKPVHGVVQGVLGGARSAVVLYRKEDMARSYLGIVMRPAADGYKKLELPQPTFTWSIEEPQSVFFANADGDRDLELFIIGECYTGIGPTGARPFYRTRVYDWKGDSFAHIESISEAIGNLKTAAAIRRQLPAIVRRAEAKFQRMDVDALNEKLSAAKDAKTPLQILAVLVDPFAEMLTRSVSIKADNVETPESLLIVVTDDGYADDSVRGAQFRFKLIRNVDGEWLVSTASKGWRCQAGRGQRDFSSKPCR